MGRFPYFAGLSWARPPPSACPAQTFRRSRATSTSAAHGSKPTSRRTASSDCRWCEWPPRPSLSGWVRFISGTPSSSPSMEKLGPTKRRRPGGDRTGPARDRFLHGGYAPFISRPYERVWAPRTCWALSAASSARRSDFLVDGDWNSAEHSVSEITSLPNCLRGYQRTNK